MDFSDVTYFGLAGYAGVAFYLSSYAALQAGLISGNGFMYSLLNLAASSLVLISLFQAWNQFSAMIQISWIAISIYGLARRWMHHRALRFNREELALVRAVFPHMEKVDQKRILGWGEWKTLPKGSILTEENEEVRELSVIMDGSVEIDHEGTSIAHVGAGGVIGEIACMSEQLASATARAEGPIRVFSIPTEKLRQKLQRDEALKQQVEAAFAASTQAKLIASNRRLRDALVAQQSVLA